MDSGCPGPLATTGAESVLRTFVATVLERMQIPSNSQNITRHPEVNGVVGVTPAIYDPAL
jgi:hypothetical protein